MVITPSEYIQIVSAEIYSIDLFDTIVTFRRTKRLDQIYLSFYLLNNRSNIATISECITENDFFN